MSSVFTVYNLKGEKVKEIEQSEIFQLPENTQVIHRYVTWIRNAIRPTLNHTKTRGEVSGGGKKPWKQKGTGRARVGSSRSPIWRKGGIVFGPLKEQNWATRMPRAERRLALLSILSSKARDNKVIVIDSFGFDKPKTKEVIEGIKFLPIEQNEKILYIHPEFDQIIFKSVANIPNFSARTISYTNGLNLLNNDIILITENTLEVLEKHYNIMS